MIMTTTMMTTPMDFEEFIRKMTKSAKDSNVHIMAFISDGNEIIFSYLGDDDVIVQAVAKTITKYPQFMDIVAQAIKLIESRNMKVTVINTEDQMNDYLIDLHLKSKGLNDSGEGL